MSKILLILIEIKIKNSVIRVIYTELVIGNSVSFEMQTSLIELF